jgi:glycosyltransferase involved in cell wall biosynthesis
MLGLVTFLPFDNHIDAQPNKMFEYMSAGVPVVSSNFPLWRDIIEGNECGICIDPLDSTAIATAIDTIVNDPELAKKMGENGKKAVLSTFNWDKEEQKLFDLYENLQVTQTK